MEICQNCNATFENDDIEYVNDVNDSTMLKIKCEHGHIFRMSWEDVKLGEWCPECQNP